MRSSSPFCCETILGVTLWLALSWLLLGCDDETPTRSCTDASDCRAGEVCLDGTCRELTGCNSDDDCTENQRCIDGLCQQDFGCTVDGDCGPGWRCNADGVCVEDRTNPDADVPLPDGDTPPECTDDAECDGDFCIGGVCCSLDRVCGDACCGDLQTCFASACVTPGAICVRQTDCEEGEYCEPALGEPPGPPPGPECLSPPATGRCLELPPPCEGEPEPDEICIRDCEFTPSCAAPHPTEPDICLIDAVESWRWGPVASEFPDDTDVWSTPVVGRVTDTNCDGTVDLLDPPNLIFVSGNTQRIDLGGGTMTGTCCHCGVDSSGTQVRDGCRRGILRILDGRTGTELISVRESEVGGGGIAGTTPALGDVDHDGQAEVVAVTYEGRIAIIEGDGTVSSLSEDVVAPFEEGQSCTTYTDCPYDEARSRYPYDCFAGHCVSWSFGWGGGLALADIEGDGTVEVVYGRTLFSISAEGSTIERRWIGTGGRGSANSLSYFVDLAGDEDLELLAGNTAYLATGEILWRRTDLPDTFTAVADFNADGAPEVVHVASASISILNGETGDTLAGPTLVSGTGSGGPPTVADFDGDGVPEIGVALADFYSMHDVDLVAGTITERWATASHDLSSSVTGSTVFDFEGDGVAEVVYNDECFLWVYDGPTGVVRFATVTSSFTGTEASLVADIDGDGQAEMVVIANGSDPRDPDGWDCDGAPWNLPGEDGVRPAWVAPEGGNAWRGVAVFGDRTNSWVGTRPLWNQHSYSVSNVCSEDDDACIPAMGHCAIPQRRRANWTVPWLNNYRQNVQAEGLFDAPDAALLVEFDCNLPVPSLIVTLRNLGEAVLPEGVVVAFLVEDGATEREIGRLTSSAPLFPGQGETLVLEIPDDVPLYEALRAIARIIIDPESPTFQECFYDNNEAETIIDGAVQCVR